MLRATIARQTVELIGCDTMVHAGDFAAFPPTSDTVDFRMTVRTADAVEAPVGEEIGAAGTVCWKRLTNGNTALYQKNGRYCLVFDNTFSDVTLTFRNGIADMAVLHYLYTAQCFSYHLMANGGFSLHSSGLDIGGNGVALAGKSGVGKSTMATQLRRCDPAITILSDDFPAVVSVADEWRLYGTPFCGQDTDCVNGDVPLRGIVLLRQATHNTVTQASPKDAVFGLLGNVPKPPYDAALSAVCADRLLQLAQQVPIWILDNDGTKEAAQTLLCELKRHRWI